METPSHTDPARQRDVGSPERELLALVSELVRELHPQRTRFIDVTPASRLDRDLGIDSLGRTELILRIERAFRVRLPIAVMGEADTTPPQTPPLCITIDFTRISAMRIDG